MDMDIDKENFEQLSISKELLIKGMSTYFTSGCDVSRILIGCLLLIGCMLAGNL